MIYRKKRISHFNVGFWKFKFSSECWVSDMLPVGKETHQNVFNLILKCVEWNLSRDSFIFLLWLLSNPKTANLNEIFTFLLTKKIMLEMYD